MLTLVLGGARSGKSRYAQSLCASSAQVIYIATARAEDATTDAEMRERIARHRADRPAHWRTVEEPLDLPRAVREAPTGAALLIDCVTLWISNLMWAHVSLSATEQEKLVLDRVADLISAIQRRASQATSSGEVVIVSNEVGSGVVPVYPVGRSFRDLQGLANQRLAQSADEVVFVVAGLPMILKSARDQKEE